MPEIIFKKAKTAKWKFFLLIPLVAVLFLLILTVLFYHNDSLAKHVPADISFYLHAQPRFFQNLSNEHQNLIAQIGQSMALDPMKLKQALMLCDQQTALVKSNGQNFEIVTFADNELKKYLTEQQIDYSLSDQNKIIHFPRLKAKPIDDNQPRFKDSANYTPKFFDISQARFYYSGEESLIFPNFISAQTIDQQFWGYLDYHDQTFSVATTLALEAAAPEFEISQTTRINSMPEQAKLYGVNLDLSKILLNPSLTPGNFKYMLFQKLSRAAEFIDFGEQYAIVLRNSELTARQIQEIIKYNAALLLPQEQERALPDNTPAIHLVANPEIWEFRQTADNSWTLTIPELNLNILLKQDSQDLIILNNLDFAEFEALSQPTSAVSSAYYAPLCKTAGKAFLNINPVQLNLDSMLKAVSIGVDKSNFMYFCLY